MNGSKTINGVLTMDSIFNNGANLDFMFPSMVMTAEGDVPDIMVEKINAKKIFLMWNIFMAMMVRKMLFNIKKTTESLNAFDESSVNSRNLKLEEASKTMMANVTTAITVKNNSGNCIKGPD